MEKKGSDHFRDILNPYGEKSNYGKNGHRRRLSKLNGFFSIILSVTIYSSLSCLLAGSTGLFVVLAIAMPTIDCDDAFSLFQVLNPKINYHQNGF